MSNFMLKLKLFDPKILIEDFEHNLLVLVGKVLDMSQTCRKVGQMSEIFDSDVEVFDIW